jgi:hypothetical protein
VIRPDLLRPHRHQRQLVAVEVRDEIAHRRDPQRHDQSSRPTDELTGQKDQPGQCA